MPDTISIPRMKPKLPNLLGEGTRLALNELNDFGSHTDVLSLQTDALSIQTVARMTANKMQIVRMLQNKSKPPDSPSRSANQLPDKPNTCGDTTNTLTIHTDGCSIGNDAGMAENETNNVKTCQVSQKTQHSSPHMPKNGTPESTYQWRKVSINNIDTYVLWSMPVEALGQTFAFGEAQSGVEAIAPSIEGERACDGDGNQNSDDMTSSSGVDLIPVETVLSPAKCQHMRQNQGM